MHDQVVNKIESNLSNEKLHFSLDIHLKQYKSPPPLLRPFKKKTPMGHSETIYIQYVKADTCTHRKRDVYMEFNIEVVSILITKYIY